MSEMKNIFKYQLWHVLSLIGLLLGINFCLANHADLLVGSLWSARTESWFWLAIAVPIVHQIYVWLVWRFPEVTVHGAVKSSCSICGERWLLSYPVLALLG